MVGLDRTPVEEPTGMAEQDTKVEEPTEHAASPKKKKRPRAGDEHAYEDSWYQVLRRLAPDDEDD